MVSLYYLTFTFLASVTLASKILHRANEDAVVASEDHGRFRVRRVASEDHSSADDEAGVRRSRRTFGVDGHGQVLKASATPSGTCEDTPGWTNNHQRTCEHYANEGWCRNHRVHETYDFWAGAKYNHPEHNCCACGKGCNDNVRTTSHNILCRNPSLAECINLTAQSLTQSQLEATLRNDYLAIESGCSEGIPACAGCEGRTNECYQTCRGGNGAFAPGLCSKCDAVSGGTKGACCMKGSPSDPPECHVVPHHYFKATGYHECVLVDRPYPRSDGMLQGEYNARECWSHCGDKGGYCSKCDSTRDANGGVIRGACCRKGDANDPTECQQAPTVNFLYNEGHACVLTEVPQCIGCGNRPGECWTACNEQRGFCSACHSIDGTRGACCMKNADGATGQAVGDPEECNVHAAAFLYEGSYHQCVLTNVARTPAPVPTPPPTNQPHFNLTLHSSGMVCESASYTTVALLNGEPLAHQSCNGWNMGHLVPADGEEQCWQHCLNNIVAPGCESIQTRNCVASEYWTAYNWCHLHSSCDNPTQKQPGAKTRMILATVTVPTPPPTTPAPTKEPQQSVNAAVEVHTASTAKPKNVTCSGAVTSDAHCVSWYKAEPEPLWNCELFPDRPTAEVKFSTINGSTAAGVLHNTQSELKYYGQLHYWDWNTLQAICDKALKTHTPSGAR